MGLYKIENVASVLIALFIFIAGFEIIREVFSPVESVPHISVIYIILLLSGTVAIFFFGQYAMSVGRKTGSPTLIAEGRHRQVDFLASVVVLFSVILSYFDFKADIMGITVDQIGAALILVFIAHAGWGLLSDGMRVLLDASLDFDTLDRVREIIRSDPMVDEIKGLVGRNAGRFRFIQAEITLKTRDLEKAHQISNTIEKKIREEIPRLEKVTIHYEPEKREYERLALPLENPEGRLSKHFGEAPYFGILEISLQKRKAVTKKILPNPHRSVETAKGIRVAEWLVKQGVEHVGLKEDVSKKGPGYVLSNGGVKLHIISAEELDQAIDEIIVQASMTSPDQT